MHTTKKINHHSQAQTIPKITFNLQFLEKYFQMLNIWYITLTGKWPNRVSELKAHYPILRARAAPPSLSLLSEVAFLSKSDTKEVTYVIELMHVERAWIDLTSVKIDFFLTMTFPKFSFWVLLIKTNLCYRTFRPELPDPWAPCSNLITQALYIFNFWIAFKSI